MLFVDSEIDGYYLAELSIFIAVPPSLLIIYTRHIQLAELGISLMIMMVQRAKLIEGLSDSEGQQEQLGQETIGTGNYRKLTYERKYREFQGKFRPNQS